MKKILSILYLSFALSNSSYADTYSGTSYNWSTGEYNNVDVSFNGSELEVYNYDTGNYEWHDIDSNNCLLYTSPSPRDLSTSRMPSSA